MLLLRPVPESASIALANRGEAQRARSTSPSEDCLEAGGRLHGHYGRRSQPRARVNRRNASATVMLLLLSLTYLLSYYDRLLMSVLGETVKHEFLLSDRQLSLLTGASFIIIYGTLGIAAGWLVDRVSRKWIIVTALLLWSLMTMACGMAQSFLQLACARAGVGVGEATNVPAGLSALSDRFPYALRPMACAIFYAGGMVGILACFLCGTWIAAHYGWRMAFLAAGPPGVLAAALIAVCFREPAREAPRRVATHALPAANSFLTVWRNRPLRWLLFANAVGTFTNVGVVQWLPNFFLRSHHMSLRQVGLYFGPVLASGMLAGLLLGGWLGNRIASRSLSALIWLCAWNMLAIIPLYVLMFWLPSLPAALAATFVGTSVSVLYAPSVNAAWQTICAPDARGTAAGVFSFANAIIGGAGCSFFVGALSDWLRPTLGVQSLRYALTAGLGFCLVAALLFVIAARLTAHGGRKLAVPAA